MSRQIMIEEEFPGLIAAQVFAAGAKSYNHWLDFMYKAFSFSVAVRMAAALGYTRPCREWYEDMKVCGKRIMKEMYETERVNYEFRDDKSKTDGVGDQASGGGEKDIRIHSTTY